MPRIVKNSEQLFSYFYAVLGSKEDYNLIRCMASAPAFVPTFSHFPCPSPYVSQHMYNRVESVRTPPLLVYAARGPHVRAMCRRDNYTHCIKQPIDSCLPTRGGDGRAHESRRRLQKMLDTNLNRNPPYRAFPAAANLENPGCQ
jgi:hypothetical protein